MNRLMMAALLASVAMGSAQAQTKKELVQKLLTLQQPGIEQVSRGLVERPAVQMMQEAGLVLQRQTAPDKREALGKQIEAEVKKYVDESCPLVRERALKIAPTTIGADPRGEVHRGRAEAADRLVRESGEQEVPVARPRDAATPSCRSSSSRRAPVRRPEDRRRSTAGSACMLGVPPAQPASAAGDARTRRVRRRRRK